MLFYRPPPPSTVITGLEWPGNEASNTQRVLTFNGSGGSASPFPFVDTSAGGATYIFKCYPKGPKNGGINFPNYWTIFFWGNYGTFSGSGPNFIGCHPYPFDGNDVSTGQNWEISVLGDDYAEADGDANHECAIGVWGAGGPPSETNNGAATAWNRWFTVVVRVFRVDANTVRHQLIFDWDLFVSSSGASGWFQKTISSAIWGTTGNDPTTPSIVIGEAPPNDANTASWGNYPGREQFKGIIRGIQLYDKCLGNQVYVPSVADLAQISSELSSPGSVRTPWYLCLNPTPSNVQSTSSSNHPWFPSGNKPTLWTGP
jgi:hypothetical protein